MQDSMGLIGLLIAAAILIAGVLLFWQMKIRVRRRVPMDSFGTFFLGGKSVGERLTTNNNWGLCFAFGNAIWYYAYLGYYYGLWIFLLQVAWSLGVVFIAWHILKYLSGSADGTVHGFIGHHYGTRAAVLAAIATLIGYTLNVGFEVFYSSHLLVASVGVHNYELLVAIVIALFVGGYCVLGGYLGSVVTDQLQNHLAVFSLIILLWFVLPRTVVISVAVLFAAYCLFGKRLGSEVTYPISKVIAVSLLILLLWFFLPVGHHGFSALSLFSASDATPPGISFVIGVVVFSFFFNLVDMANWQSIAANKDLLPSELQKVKIGFFWSAGLQMIAPAALGTLFGAALHLASPGVADDGYFAAVLKPLLASMTPMAGVILGILFLGFVSATVSSAGSYLVAAMQTLAVDVIKRKPASILRSSGANLQERAQAEESILGWVKKMMVPVAILMTVIFASLYYSLSRIDMQGLAFQFQFVMYGAAVTLVPSVVFSLFRNNVADAAPNVSSAGFWSILIGLIFVIVPFGLAETVWTRLAIRPLALSPDDIVNLTPLTGLVAAAVTFSVVRLREVRSVR